MTDDLNILFLFMYHNGISLIKMLITIIRFSYTSGLCSSLEATDQISPTQNNANSFAGTVASLSYLTSCTSTISHLCTHSLAAAVKGLTNRDTWHSKSTSAASFVPKNPNTTTALQDLGGFFGIRWFKEASNSGILFHRVWLWDLFTACQPETTHYCTGTLRT